MTNLFDYKIFADCGAPSLYNKLSRKTEHKGIMGTRMSERKCDDFSYTETPEYKQYLDDYIQFLLDNKGKITAYSNLDVINNPKLTLRNQKIIEEAGLSPIPVFHLGSDPKYLERYIRKYDYIAIGGLVPNPTKVLRGLLDSLFKEYLLDSDGFPKVKLHGFACTALPLMTRYPWWSVDSATCRKLAMYGWIALEDHSNTPKVFTMQISTRDIELKYRLGKGRIKELDRRAKQRGTSIEELCDSIIGRCIWNYITFSEIIQKHVLPWPWGIKDISGSWDDRTNKKSKKGADEYLTFYFAGSLSKKEETIFWKGITDESIARIKGRLQSFFYKGNLEHVIQLKK